MALFDGRPNEKVIKYERFINETLREDLKHIIEKRDNVYARTAEYLQLKNTIQGIKDADMTDSPLKTKIDLGSNFYVNAIVPDPSRIFVQIGLDVHVELTLDEALAFIEKRVAIFEMATDKLTEQSAAIKGRIKMILEGLRELQMLDPITEKQSNSRRDVL